MERQSSDTPPHLLVRLSSDPNATVAWTQADPKMVIDASMKAVMFGRGTGEEFQMCFTQGHIVVQPYEEVVTYGSEASGASGAGIDSLFNAFG